MWRLYLEVGILVVIAFGLGALVASVVVRRLVPLDPPDDELGPAPTNVGASDAGWKSVSRRRSSLPTRYWQLMPWWCSRPSGVSR